MSPSDKMHCPGCDDEHAEWTDQGTAPAGPDSPAMLDLWGCLRCGYTLEGVVLVTDGGQSEVELAQFEPGDQIKTSARSSTMVVQLVDERLLDGVDLIASNGHGKYHFREYSGGAIFLTVSGRVDSVGVEVEYA